jgi:hypothetical protein
MTATRARVDAAAVTLTDFDVLEVGTTVAWNGWTAQHGTLFSPLERETSPDVVALVDGHQVDVLHLTDTGRYRRTATVKGGATLAQVLDQVDALVPAEPVLRFATGRELDARGLRDVPAVALWTGPDVPAWQVPLTGRRRDLRGFRVSWQDTLSHRVTGDGAADAASARLTAVQDPGDTWYSLRHPGGRIGAAGPDRASHARADPRVDERRSAHAARTDSLRTARRASVRDRRSGRVRAADGSDVVTVASISHAVTGVAASVREVVDTYKEARRDRDAAIVAAVEVLGQRGAAEASGLSRRRVRQIVDEAAAADRSGGPQ